MSLTYSSFPSMLNGTVVNCTLDSDCPGTNGLCATPGRAPWLETTGSQCVCPTWVGFQGANCDQVSSLGWFVFALHVVGLLIVFVDFVMVARVVRGMVAEAVAFKPDASHTTFIFAAIATTMLCIALPVFLTRPFVEFLEYTDRKGVVYRETKFVHLTGIVTAAVYFFCIAMTLNLSLMWIQVANRVKNMSVARFSSNVTSALKYAILIYLIFFATAVIVMSFLNFVGYTAMIALPGVLYIDTTFIVAAVKMNKLIKTLPLQPDTLNSLKLIINTAVKIFVVMIFITLTIIILVALGSKLKGNPPDAPAQSIVATFIYIELGVLTFLVLQYLQRAGLGMSSTKLTADSQSNNKNNNTGMLSKITGTASKINLVSDVESMASPHASSDKQVVAAYQT